MVLVIADDLEGDCVLQLLLLGCSVSRHEPQAHVLHSKNIYLSVHSHKIVGLILILFYLHV